jgi:hypothetical protein
MAELDMAEGQQPSHIKEILYKVLVVGNFGVGEYF